MFGTKEKQTAAKLHGRTHQDRPQTAPPKSGEAVLTLHARETTMLVRQQYPP